MSKLKKLEAELLEANKEIDRLREAIRDHRDQKRHDRCWLDDLALYAVLPEEPPADAGELPGRSEFLLGCERYYDLRRKMSKEEADKIARKFNDGKI